VFAAHWLLADYRVIINAHAGADGCAFVYNHVMANGAVRADCNVFFDDRKSAKLCVIAYFGG
jgi:hypothetical protein